MIIILLSLGLGIAAGYLQLFPLVVKANFDLLINWALGFLLWGVGLEIGSKKEIVANMRVMGYRVLLLPVAVAVGSIVGTVMMGSLWGMSSGDSAAIGAGFGWYSLSGILLANLRNVELGVLAVLTNVSREILALLLIPLLARHLGPYAAIAPGGATTMDVTLPLIVKIVGSDYALIAFFHGLILSALVPLLIPLFV
ncbi:MAG: lysine exporter LysO family protein [bacterium]|jgi:uncharacterized membrane protein YbjE (DUF340 family)